MRLTRTIAAALAGMAVMAAAAAATAEGAQKKLDMIWGMDGAFQLEPGEEFRLNNTTSMTAETGSGGRITCTAGTFPNNQGWIGEDKTNNLPTDTIELTTVFYSGAPCSNNTSLGASAAVEFFANGDLLTLSSKGVAEIKSTAGGPEPSTSISYSGGDTCAYFAKKLKGSLKLVPDGPANQMEIDFAKQKEKLDKGGSSATCPKTILVNAPFAYQTTDSKEAWFVLAMLD